MSAIQTLARLVANCILDLHIYELRCIRHCHVTAFAQWQIHGGCTTWPIYLPLFLAAERQRSLKERWGRIARCCCVYDVISLSKDSFLRYTCLLVICDCKTVKMTIIVFLVDTSASMNQRAYTGTTILDTAKGAVETFMKVNQLFLCVKYSVLRLMIILCCVFNWNMRYFRSDREIRTADGTVTCCWHSTNRLRTSE